MDDSTPRFRVVHATRYAFDETVAGGCTLDVSLEPRGASFHQLVSRPLPARLTRLADALGNTSARLTISEPFATLTLTAISVASASEPTPPSDPTTLARLAEPGPPSPATDACRDYARLHLDGATPAALHRFVERLHADFTFDATTLSTAAPDPTLDHFLATRRGVCEDFARFTLTCLRARSLPACYVSGYLARPTARGASHAWTQVHLPHHGWLALDPTLGRTGPLGHIPLAVGHDRESAAPIRGTLDYRGDCRLTTSVKVTVAMEGWARDDS